MANFMLYFLYLVAVNLLPASANSCEEVAVPECAGLGYGRTLLPNTLGQAGQTHVRAELQPYLALVNTNCSSLLRNLLCSLYLPPCSGPSSPCRHFCEGVRDDCLPALTDLGLTWPLVLDCSRLPQFPQEGVTCFSHVEPPAPSPSGQCEPLTAPMCRDLGYDSASFPNSLGHTTQDDASLELHQFYPLVNVNCSPNLKSFLCSLYSPPCAQARLQLPCREMCEEARSGCEGLMRNFGFEWPAALNCSKFPIGSSGESCLISDVNGQISLNTAPTTLTTTAVTTPSEDLQSHQNCETLDIPLCSDVPYTQVKFPNLLGHVTQNEAEASLDRYRALTLSTTECSQRMREFLCMYHAPPCTIMETAIPPCRHACERARADCAATLNDVGMPWADILDCSQFPITGLCLNPYPLRSTQSTKLTTELPTTTTPTPPTPSGTAAAATEDSVHAVDSSQCEAVTAPMCGDMNYNMTRFPNFLGHEAQEDAALEVHQFWPLVEIACSRALKSFLCSVYVPPCSSSAVQLPCREMCEEARSGCEKLMNNYGFAWPGALHCSKFPVGAPGEPCLISDGNGQISHNTASTTELPTTTTTTTTTTEDGVRLHLPSQCEAVTVPMCRDMNYNMTRFPNFLGDEAQEDAGVKIHLFFPLVRVNCSPALKPFLCSLYIPPCSSSAVIPPCRRLCEMARLGGCEQLMINFGFEWPQNMNCLRFPVTGCLESDADEFISETPAV